MDCSKDVNADSKNPKRVAAGRRNRQKRGDLTEEGRQRVRDWANDHKPWLKATGPKTAAGKRRAALNGRLNQPVDGQARAMREELAGVSELIQQMRETMKQAG